MVAFKSYGHSLMVFNELEVIDKQLTMLFMC